MENLSIPEEGLILSKQQQLVRKPGTSSCQCLCSLQSACRESYALVTLNASHDLQLTSKDPEGFRDLTSSKKSLSSLGVNNGDMVSCMLCCSFFSIG